MNHEAKLKALGVIADRLRHAGVQFTLGGSCLLFAHGLIKDFDDIDLLTEDKEDKVLVALKGIELRKVAESGIYSSEFFYKFNYGGCAFDLLGQFNIQGPLGKQRIHSVPRGTWNGIPLGSLKIWRKAYELMGRPDKVDLISPDAI
jgi:hypothetical protein